MKKCFSSVLFGFVLATCATATGMVLIPGGTNIGIDPDNRAYSLTVSSFYMDTYEVSKAKWDDVYAWAVENGYSFDNAGSGKAANHPVHTVSWYDCVKWCNARSEKEGRSAVYTVGGAVYKVGQRDDVVQTAAAGYRLPTDTEWAYAARGGLSGKRFPWGDTITHSQANYYSSILYSYDTSPTRGYHPTYNDGAYPYTSPAGAFAANGYGLYDMAGNVWEWCFDWHPDYNNSHRVSRGGSWSYYADYCRAARRNYGWPDFADFYVGFRAVLPPSEENIPTPVHRFWSDQFGSHFYIMGDSERDRIAAKYPGIWNYEAVAWYAYPEQVTGTEPVHRFWSDQIGKHFYIMGDSERDRIADKYRGVWNYEAVAWYAYPEEVSGTDPVGRFWSDTFMGHFYIITQSEINRIAAKYPGIWNYETVAYWAYKTLPVGERAALTDQVKFVAEKVNGAPSQEQRSMAFNVFASDSEDVSSGIDIVYPLTVLGSQVAAYVYDSATEQWTCVLPVTNAPASAVFENLQPDCRYLFDVSVSDSDDGEMVSVHQSAFEYQLDPPETIHEDSDVVAQDDFGAIGISIIRIKTPVVDESLTVKLYSSSQGVVETLTNVPGGEMVELSIPEWNRWYWVGGWRDADNELVLSIWLRQEN